MLMRSTIEDKEKSYSNSQEISIMRRKKLWEIDKHYHCSIIGICLTIKELKKIANKTEIAIEKDEDHIIHGNFVALASEKSETAKLMHKIIDRKYNRFIRQFSRAKTENDLESLWEKSLEEGNIQ